MSTRTSHPARRARWAAVAVVSGLATALATLPASAAPAPVTTQVNVTTAPGTPAASGTVDPDELARLCTDRLPAVQARAEHLIEVIEAGPQTPGSVAWLQARADTLEQNGNPERAQVVRARANLRTTHVADLTRLVQRLEDAAATYCTGVS